MPHWPGKSSERFIKEYHSPSYWLTARWRPNYRTTEPSGPHTEQHITRGLPTTIPSPCSMSGFQHKITRHAKRSKAGFEKTKHTFHQLVRAMTSSQGLWSLENSRVQSRRMRGERKICMSDALKFVLIFQPFKKKKKRSPRENWLWIQIRLRSGKWPPSA